jgi:bacterioferritin
MKHAEMLIAASSSSRHPIVSKLKDIRIGADVPNQLAFDHAAEEEGHRRYNAASTRGEVSDFALPRILEKILNDDGTPTSTKS